MRTPYRTVKGNHPGGGVLQEEYDRVVEELAVAEVFEPQTYYMHQAGYNSIGRFYFDKDIGDAISADGRTISTSGRHEIKINWELNLKNGESKALIYKNGNLHSTENYTLTADELSTAKGLASSNKYFYAEFARGYKSVTMFIKSWKIMIKD